MSPVVILTALDLEYQAVREKLVGPRLHRHSQGTLFEVGRLAAGRGEVVLAHVGKGNLSAGVLAERAIAEFRPAALLFVGVAGALHTHIALGDVVVATHVYAFHGGTSEDDGFKSRPRVWETSHAADQIAQHLHRAGSWTRDLDPRPEVHFGPIAAGEVVLNSRLSEYAHWIREHYNDACAIEMEGAGVAQAGHLNQVPVVVIRGISDRADGTKETTDREQWQPRAVANAATFAAALAEELSTERPTTRSSAMPETNTNIAQGNAHVGVQAGTVHGGIWIAPQTSRPAELPEALAGFRSRLWQAWADGRLDEATYKAAEAELVTADQALETKTPDRANTLTLALKKLCGLVGDVADLAAELTVIIALAQSLS
ncbi:5'-methylthioadenosine/S-adenosylhomocysteine nucleosidase [Nonomuraea sp. KC401]|uniref:5'-methylthioadenosine/S-adenosylhomocysteine nucleosidase n=1 Tax=unclassified Nonomuraea TaxID=2593643 RepID=UPI0010FD8761|nr:5'-methylthioadenosine/S-adenosylhomocysteine nucleosidase [Nonomuraea sp. KC401]NBE99701.1 purine phosphorylase [Nonomuraea sp. K271]TLF56449.1 5'-methylthioadenosine/S-adenosylhomocysteine nucleosidase [Nonomuraea sp. KC401]